jgi:hypothetical protein
MATSFSTCDDCGSICNQLNTYCYNPWWSFRHSNATLGNITQKNHQWCDHFKTQCKKCQDNKCAISGNDSDVFYKPTIDMPQCNRDLVLLKSKVYQNSLTYKAELNKLKTTIQDLTTQSNNYNNTISTLTTRIQELTNNMDELNTELENNANISKSRLEELKRNQALIKQQLELDIEVLEETKRRQAELAKKLLTDITDLNQIKIQSEISSDFTLDDTKPLNYKGCFKLDQDKLTKNAETSFAFYQGVQSAVNFNQCANLAKDDSPDGSYFHYNPVDKECGIMKDDSYFYNTTDSTECTSKDSLYMSNESGNTTNLGVYRVDNRDNKWENYTLPTEGGVVEGFVNNNINQSKCLLCFCIMIIFIILILK